MLNFVWQKQKTKKNLLLLLLYFTFFIILYTLIDSFNLSYQQMNKDYGFWLVAVNIFLNLLMSLTSASMISLASLQFDLSGKESKGSNVPFFSLLLGILTYGCTPCVISFFAAIGLSFSVAVLPFAGLPYKLISFGVLLLGLCWVLYSIKNTKCNLPKS